MTDPLKERQAFVPAPTSAKTDTTTTDDDPLAQFKRLKPNVLDPVSAKSLAQSQGFKGDSSYDEGLAFGLDQGLLRANNQGIGGEAGNALLQTVPGIGLGILENIGYLGDLAFDWDNSKDYTNGLVELAKKGREKLGEELPIY